MNFHWYEECYLEALAEKGYDHAPKGVVKPWVYLAEIYWPGHGNGPNDRGRGYGPTLDLHIVAPHSRFIKTIGGGTLTIVSCQYDHKHVMGLHPYRYEVPVSDGNGDVPFAHDVGHYESGRWVGFVDKGVSRDEDRCRIYAQEIAKMYNYAGEIYEYGTYEQRFTGKYGT